MEICKIAKLALALTSFIFTVHAFAEEAIPFHGKIEIGAIESFGDKIYSRILSAALPKSVGSVQFKSASHAITLNPSAFFSRSGIRQVKFQIGTCSGPSYKSSRINGLAAAEHGDLFAAKAYFDDWKKRAVCEAEKTVQCNFNYDEKDEDHLRIALATDSCIGDVLGAVKLKESAFEVYRVDGNNVAVTDGSERPPSPTQAQP